MVCQSYFDDNTAFYGEVVIAGVEDIMSHAEGKLFAPTEEEKLRLRRALKSSNLLLFDVCCVPAH